MLGRLFGYIDRNQTRLLANIEASAQETPQRAALVFSVFGALAQFTDWRIAAVCAVIGLADDIVLFLVRNSLRRKIWRGGFLIVAAFNFAGATAFAGFLAHLQMHSDNMIASLSAAVVLIGGMVELASPKSGRHAFAIVTLIPIWLALFISISFAMIEFGGTSFQTVTGLLVLTVAAVHTSLIFAETAKRTWALEEETARANAANDQKTRFLGTMSHEIRTPLHALYGTAQLLTLSDDINEVHRLGRILLAAAGDLKVIVDDVVDFANVEAGQITLRPVSTDLSSFTQRIGDLFLGPARAKGLTLAVDVDGTAQRALALLDPARVGQVLSNLLSNAVKFTDKGGVVLRVEVDAAQQLLRFHVSDTGDGIPHEDRQRIFEPYGKFRKADHRPGRHGAGLGLASSRVLASHMGGHLSLGESSGSGAVFSLILPLQHPGVQLPHALDVVPQSTPATPQRPAKAGPSKRLGALRILVVDDVAINREVMRAMLEHHGARVLEAEDGRAALEIIEAHPLDVVLLDNMMPVMTGREMLAELRSRKGPERNLTVIGISAGSIQAERDAFIELGLNAFLSKPVSMRQLTETVEQACKLIDGPDSRFPRLLA